LERSEHLNERYTVSAAQRQSYERSGFVRIAGVFDRETVRFFRERISREVVRRNPASAPLGERDTYHRAFLQVTNLWRTDEAARRFVFGKRLAAIAAQLLGVDAVRLYHDQALYKEPGGGITPWHADQYYWPLSSDKTITAWVPLQDTPLEMGPLAFATGSQTMEYGRDLAIGDQSEQNVSEALKSHGHAEDVAPFASGDVSFHSGWTFHHTGANRTREPRAVMTVIYMEDGLRLTETRRKEHYADWEAFMPGVTPGRVVDSPLNPVLS